MIHQHQHQQFYFTVRERQRLARDAVSWTVLVDLKRQWPRNWDGQNLTMNQIWSTEYEIFFIDLVSKIKIYFDSKESAWCTSRLKYMSFEFRWNRSKNHLWELSHQSHTNVTLFVMIHAICATAIADPKRLRSFPGPKFKIQLDEYFHDTNERNLVESYRLVAERDRVMFEGRVFLHKYEEEKKKSETWQDNFIQVEKQSQSFFQDYIAGQDTDRSMPSRSDETVSVTWTETSTVLWHSHVSGNPLLIEGGKHLPHDAQFGKGFLVQS